ncbi:MAG TPA: cyclase family protein [Solirubrobacteraceae bacterium]|jgi:kynurenine formamidase|nr:cyclase family protein [Solirubrobacteraceae bacterium]
MHTAFDQLPLNEPLGLRCAWDVLDHDLGTLARMTPETVQRAVACVRDGTVIPLNLPVTEPDPPLFGREAIEHAIYPISRNDMDDRVDRFFPQASSQWDGLRHVRAREQGYFGGGTEDPQPGPGPLGIEKWAERGIVGRGVLVDACAYLSQTGDYEPLRGDTITAEDLHATIEHQGVTLQAGDVMCLRTGWIEAFRELPADERAALAREPRISGLAGSEDVARLLWDGGLIAIAADNPPVEVTPGDPKIGSLHRRLIPMLGFAIAELLDLKRLSGLCAADRRFDFLFVAAPMNLPGGVGSPANAVAIR